MPDDQFVTRRCALGALALGASAPILVACGRDDGAAAEGPTGAAPDTTSNGGASDPTTEAGDTGQADTGQPGGGEPLVAVSEVPVGAGVILAERQLIVTQPEAGEFRAFSAVCPHAQVILSEVTSDDIYCGNGHGSRFAIDDGAIINGPATSPLTAIEVAVEGDQVVRS